MRFMGIKNAAMYSNYIAAFIHCKVPVLLQEIETVRLEEVISEPERV